MNYSDNNSNERPGKTPRSLSIHKVVCSDLKAWLDGELPPGRTWYVRLHLFCCRECREEVKWLKRLGEDMRDLEKAVPGPGLRARILAALPDSPPGGAIRPLSYRPVWPRYAFSGAALLVLGAAAFAAIQVGRHAPGAAATPVVPASKGAGLVNGDPSRTPQIEEKRPEPTVTVPPITDPTTLEANALAERQEEDKARQEVAKLRQNRLNWSKLAATVQSLEMKSRAARPERVDLSVSVPDLAEAELRLQSWAQSAKGASAIAPQQGTVVQGAAPSATSVNSGTQPMPTPMLADSHTIVLRVPVNVVASLQPVLKQLGAWDRSALQPDVLTPPGTTWSPSSALPSKRAATKPPRVVHTDAATDKGTENVLKNPGTVHTADQTAARDTSPVLVTLVVHLTSLDSSFP